MIIIFLIIVTSISINSSLIKEEIFLSKNKEIYNELLNDLHKFLILTNDINLPANDIFISKSTSLEKEKISKTERDIDNLLNSLKSNLKSKNIESDILLIEKMSQDIIKESELVLNLYERKNISKATSLMTRIDNNSSILRNKVFSLIGTIQNKKDFLTKSKEQNSESIELNKKYIIYFLIIIFGLILTYILNMIFFIKKLNFFYNQRIKALNESSIVLTLNDEFKIQSVNKKFLEINKSKEKDVLGKDYFSLFKSLSNKESIISNIKNNNMWNGVNDFLDSKNDTYSIRSSIIPLFDNKGRLESIIDFQTDITKKKRLEKDLLESKRIAEESVLAKSKFLANISHEIRTPMNGIIGITELLISDVTNEKYLEKLNIIKKCSNSLLNLVNDVLDFSKIEAKKIILEQRPFDLYNLLKESIEIFTPKVNEKGLKLSLNKDIDVPNYIIGDEARIRQIIFNLVNNAIKFTKEGGIHISLKAKRDSEDQVSLFFKIKDTGVGIDDFLIKKLFQPYHQADASTTREFGGTGLGLVICKELCEQMGGEITVKSIRGEGSVFSFSVKVKEYHGLLNKETDKINFDKNFSKNYPLNILIAEDDEINQLVINEFFNRLGYSVDISKNGEEALKLINNKKYDLFFVDHNMPVMDGITTIEELIKKYNEKDRPKIISLSANLTNLELTSYANLGVDFFIEKPINLNDIIKVLTNQKEVKKEKDSENNYVFFNKKRFLYNFNGIESLSYKVCSSFIEKLPEEIQLLKNYIFEKNEEGIRLLSHRLRGAVSVFYSEKCQSSLLKLESMIINKEYSYELSLDFFEEIKSNLFLLEESILNFLKEKKD